ncbi:6-phospho-beta-glucosidase [Pseudarthrobacter sp. H3Y2-7]|uniref:family 4 glycosyl hydrolase n=1 Tax=Pseudarthrobacter naphthalenicus TaxID=3031328 RepID=UPI0023B06D1E|nr:6-phospho-beta-glucosidase [Pseudarthrobacter sp. H3Y2-7]MDE8667165.1 6-phospho-beta-glucosidase [Pseudarthrobacter sp. H3Y2-7]
MRLMIAGGGGFRVPLVYRALASGPFAGLVSELVLFDVDPARLSAIAAVLRAMPLPDKPASDGGAPAGAPPPAVRTTTSLPDALRGTDLVFAAIRPGGTAGRIADERVARDLGLMGQETTGPGGISYALRTIPEMLHLARQMRDLCPDAWLINFTNPAGMVTEALVPVLGRKVIGICDSAGGLVHRAARAAGVSLPDGRLDGVGYCGLNHLGWLYRLESGGRDLLPGLLADPAALASFEEGRLFPQPFLAELGALPNEYLYYYYQRDAAAAAMRTMPVTRGESIHHQQAELYPRLAASGADAYRLWDAARRSREEGYLAEARTHGEQRDEADLAGGGYERVALAVMRALAGGTADGSGGPGTASGGRATQLILNTPNTLPTAPAQADTQADTQAATAAGTPPQPAIPGLPADAVVEVPCTVTPDGALPLPQSAPGHDQLALLQRVKRVEQLTVRAATQGDRAAAVDAFSRHPLVDSAVLGAALLEGYERAFPGLGALWRQE